MSTEKIKAEILGKLKRHYGKTLEMATPEQVYQACAMCIKDRLIDEWLDAKLKAEKEGKKTVFYMSAEFLIGRALVNNMVNLKVFEKYQKALSELGLDIYEIEKEERDPCLLYTSRCV